MATLLIVGSDQNDWEGVYVCVGEEGKGGWIMVLSDETLIKNSLGSKLFLPCYFMVIL